MTGHTPTPWSYRPQKYDDWGFIRGPKEADGFAPIAAIARGETSETHDLHRAAGTDPYGPNALLIVKAVNSHDALVAMLEEARLQIEYMQSKFEPTGTGNAVLARIRHVLSDVGTPPTERT